MELSIIITTFQRPHLLKWGLLSLSKQTITCPYEILVINDGIDDDATKSVCDSFQGKLPIRYIFTGQRNKDGLKWRVAGAAINIGIRQALGKNIILSCAEMFVLDDCVQKMVDVLNAKPKSIVITNGKDDTSGMYLRDVEKTNGYPTLTYEFGGLVPLCTYYAFFMGISRQWVIDIGGYCDNAYLNGYAYEDTSFARRIKNDGGVYEFIPGRVVHLYHPRNDARPGISLDELQVLLKKNKQLYDEENGKIIANEGQEWGILEQ